MKKYYMIMLMLLIAFVKADGQNTKRYDLTKMLIEKDLIISPGYSAQVFEEGEKRGITCTGTVWLKDIAFEEGIVELDKRGRNEFLKSFVGIVFNAVDTITRENICFRPFNFKHPDPVRRSYSLQYTSDPEYTYERLRSDYPLQFEHEIIPNPKPEDWIHAKIVVKKDSVSVYVNKTSTPSLKVKRLTIQRGNKIGLWVFGKETSGDFSNLIITTLK